MFFLEPLNNGQLTAATKEFVAMLLQVVKAGHNAWIDTWTEKPTLQVTNAAKAPAGSVLIEKTLGVGRSVVLSGKWTQLDGTQRGSRCFRAARLMA